MVEWVGKVVGSDVFSHHPLHVEDNVRVDACAAGHLAGRAPRLWLFPQFHFLRGKKTTTLFPFSLRPKLFFLLPPPHPPLSLLFVQFNFEIVKSIYRGLAQVFLAGLSDVLQKSEPRPVSTTRTGQYIDPK